MVRWHMPPTDLRLTDEEREALERLARGRDRMDLVTRARGILMVADGATYTEVHDRLGWSSRTPAMWKQRFPVRRLTGLRADAIAARNRRRSRRPSKRAFCRRRARPRRTDPPIGVPANSRRC